MESHVSTTSTSGTASWDESNLALLSDFFALSQNPQLTCGIVLGAFELLHAGTVHFLRQARQECNRLFACVLPRDGSQSGTMLRVEERLQLLLALEQVSGACIIHDPQILPRLARQWATGAKWFKSDSECDVAESLWLDITRSGARTIALPGDGSCTTPLLLKRMAARKSA